MGHVMPQGCERLIQDNIVLVFLGTVQVNQENCNQPTRARSKWVFTTGGQGSNYTLPIDYEPETISVHLRTWE